MNYIITYYNDTLQDEIMALPEGLSGRYFALTDRMELHGANLGLPHTKPLVTACLSCALKA